MSRVTVTFDDALLRRIDEAARKAGLSRSAYLARLAARELDRTTGPGAEPGVHEAIDSAREISRKYTSGPDAVTAIRELRDSS